MNPLAIGLIVSGIVLLIFGIFSLRNHRMKGLALSIAGVLVIALPFIATYLVAE